MADTVLTYELDTITNTYTVKSCTSVADDGIVNIPKEYNSKKVAKIGDEAFKNNISIKKVIIPDSVMSIGGHAFQNCKSLTNITIPDSVTLIGSSAFSGCPIKVATVPANAISSIPQSALETVVITSGTSIPSYAFSGCTSLTSVTIPDSVTSIDWYAFRNCTSLVAITIPDSVTSIGDDAFRNCTSLLFVVIPETVSTFGRTIFNQCSSSAKFYFQYNNTTKDLDIGVGGTKLYYYYPNMPYNDMDFLGFTFNGKHSYLDLGVIRIIKDRIQTQLSPDISDLTAESTGSDGMYFFDSYHKSRKFTIDFAFDSLTET